MATNKYTVEEVITNLKLLADKLGREPNVFDVEADPNLPTARTIQRRFGGLQELRKACGFKNINHTHGEKRSNIARIIQQKASEYESKLINKMFAKHHGCNSTVTRQFAYQQYLPDAGHYINISCDVAVEDSDKGHVYMFDFFYPSTRPSLAGCVRNKLNKLKKNPPNIFDATYSIIFVCVNPNMDKEDIRSVPTDLGGAVLMDYQTFVRKWLT
jgi:hypothetical protein